MNHYVSEFLTVIVASLVAACLIVTLYSLGLRLGDGEQRWRRPVSILMFALCGLAVVLGIFLIVPALRSIILG